VALPAITHTPVHRSQSSKNKRDEMGPLKCCSQQNVTVERTRQCPTCYMTHRRPGCHNGSHKDMAKNGNIF